MIIASVTIGLVLGFLEWLIIFASRQKAAFLIYVQSVFFWFTCGVMIGLIDLKPYYLSGPGIALFLCMPWFIALSIIPKQYNHLVPLVVSSLILGLIGGFIKSALIG